MKREVSFLFALNYLRAALFSSSFSKRLVKKEESNTSSKRREIAAFFAILGICRMWAEIWRIISVSFICFSVLSLS